jgi:sterol 24-C-methyltransferase
VNLNDTQLQRARQRADAAGLGNRVELVKADFARLPLPDASFDVVYAIEATCHADDRHRVFAEAFRVLVPGGRFVGYEWCSTHTREPSNAEHERVLRAIAEGNALPSVTPTGEVDAAILAAGFELREARDVTVDCDPQTPWWMALDGEGGLRHWPRTPIGRAITTKLVRVLEASRVAPRGSSEVSALLNYAADALVEGGRLGIFTPMYRFSAVKPV